jgi:hypothetical protein
LFCPRCGGESRDGYEFCMHCGFNFKEGRAPEYPYPPYQPRPGMYPILDRKDPGIAVILALLPGLIGIMGIGHIYVGKMVTGFLLLVTGLFLYSLAGASILIGFFTMGAGFILTVVIVLVILLVLIVQTLDANKLAKNYNDHVLMYGRAPW